MNRRWRHYQWPAGGRWWWAPGRRGGLRPLVGRAPAGAPWAVLLSCLAPLAELRAETTLWVDQSVRAAAPTGEAGAPYATIAEALKAAGPGATVGVKGGVYPESLRIPSGDKTRALVLKGAPGERVMVSGMAPISGWQESGGGVYQAAIPWRPAALYASGRESPPARHPKGVVLNKPGVERREPGRTSRNPGWEET